MRVVLITAGQLRKIVFKVEWKCCDICIDSDKTAAGTVILTEKDFDKVQYRAAKLEVACIDRYSQSSYFDSRITF